MLAMIFNTENLKEVSEISNDLYITGLNAATPKKCRELGITLLIDASNMPPLATRRSKYDSSTKVVQININDEESARIYDYFHEIADLLHEETRNGGKCLVHCYAGISRSSSLCIAYLVKHREMTLKQAYVSVKEARDRINPNMGFWRQLIEFEEEVRGEKTVKMFGNCVDILMDSVEDNLKPSWKTKIDEAEFTHKPVMDHYV